MPVFDVYSREGCHLCEVLLEALLELVRGRAVVRVHDIDADRRLLAIYDIRVPVVECQGSIVSETSLDRERVEAALAEQA